MLIPAMLSLASVSCLLYVVLTLLNFSASVFCISLAASYKVIFNALHDKFPTIK